MDAFWSRSSTLGAKQKAFSWRIDTRGNIFIKRKFRHARFPRIDKISCTHLNKLDGFMQDREWKDLANNVAKLHRRNEKEGIGNFLYRLRPDVSYAQLSSQLGAIFYRSGVWEWNEQKRGMQFQLLPGDWREKTVGYYRSSLEKEHGSILGERYPEAGEKGEGCQKAEQTRLSAFFSS
ncbi:hypothetical protein [Methanosarcina sp. KYL-1]|uniref:hypothetical protein n=1 Tax=Methanosarcina sp. KYL-1 TaxID=2602068 RepID=UPI002101AD57|nr:hypothetical protein [Methanosarcina sp. KYL-1]